MKNNLNLKKLYWLLLIPLGALLFHITSYFPQFIERFYSNGFYRLISQPLSLLTGLLPFSLMEIGLIFITVGIISLLIYMIVKAVKHPKAKWEIFFKFILNLVAAGCIIYFLLILLWSINYNRQPFSEIARLDVRPASTEELAAVCKEIINHANELRTQVTEASNGVFHIQGGFKDISRRCKKGYENAKDLYPELGGSYGNPKGIIFSEAMSYTAISGVFCPFTGEANVDIAMPDLSIPSTAMHEMAHQRGFAREDEANYISYLCCSLHPDADFQYSGTVLALIYSMNALYDSDQDRFHELRALYSEGLVKDLQNHSEYWHKHEGKVEKLTDSINNAYLKANRQKDGVKSYGRMVDLLIAQYRK